MYHEVNDMADNPNSDILTAIQQGEAATDAKALSNDQLIIDQLEKINKNLENPKVDRSYLSGSQSSARDRDIEDRFRNIYNDNKSPFNRRTLNDNRQNRSGSFLDEFENSILEGFLGSDFKGKISDTFSNLADQLGVPVRDLPGTFGKQLGKNLMNSFKNSKLGGKLTDSIQTSVNDLTSRFKKGFADSAKEKLLKSKTTANLDQGMSASDAISNAQDSLSNITSDPISALKNAANSGDAVSAALSGLKGGISNVIGGLGEMAPKLLKVGAVTAVAMIAIDKLSEAFGPLLEGFGKLAKAVKNAANRDEQTRQKNLEASQRRLEADVETLIKKPFEILEESAKKVEQAWDDSLRVITATQGYDKADVQDLMSAFADRIRQEGLTDVISGTSVIENLTKVIDEGLSGKVAEEFAYQASVLKAAIPTQDFFGYAATYSSIAANAIKNGKSESAAIQEANASLKDFANNLLYASRELVGGYTTGLKNAQSLYEQAVKITQAAKTGSSSQVAGVLTSVAATVGAIAPDLANSLTDVVYKAATGGNASDLVALRSLAGGNASNTEFLRALANNPQKVFSKLFENLANMYNDSNDAFMEKAEGYASLFGLSQEAFQRIDFNYLAKSIANMNVESNALDQNMKLLASGQTTLTQEQLKNREINKYMLEEGLSYVLDNDAARAIQQHMWDEQIAREMQETTYGVELVGGAAEAISGLAKTAKNILNILNPFAWLKKAANVSKSRSEASGLESDIQQVLELGRVGNGNKLALSNLITRNANLNLAQNLVSMLGGTSKYANAGSGWAKGVLSMSLESSRSSDTGFFAALKDAYSENSSAGKSPTSKYGWGTMTKSDATTFSTIIASLKGVTAGRVASVKSGTSASEASTNSLVSRIEQMMSDSYLSKYINQDNPRTYEEWAASAKGLGISNFTEALESAGYTEAQMREYFEGKETESGSKATAEMKEAEQTFYKTATAFITDTHSPFLKDVHSPFITNTHKPFIENFVKTNMDPTWAKLDTINSTIQTTGTLITNVINTQAIAIRKHQTSWLTAWNLFNKSFEPKLLKEHVVELSRYFVQHKVYDSAYTTARLNKVLADDKQEKGDIAYAIAESLTSINKSTSENQKALKEAFTDPTVQTNQLLSQILIVCNAIMNQNNSAAGSLSLADSIAALSMGMTTTT